jgi:hypothetical protein
VRDDCHSTTQDGALLEQTGQLISIFVNFNHPLLQLQRALDWQAIREVMVRHWQKNGKNIAGGRGLPWPVFLYVPLLVLKFVKHLHSRHMEAYVNENVVARVFIGCQQESKASIRDHASIARAEAALGAEGIKEVNHLIIKEAVRLGFGDPTVLSGDTTAQELPIGYPNEPGILKGLAQRCLRALSNLKKKGVRYVKEALEESKQVINTAKEYHLFAKTKEEKEKLLKRMLRQSEKLIKQTTAVTARVRVKGQRVKQSALDKLKAMQEVAKILIPQIKHWLQTGKVATGKIIHSGIREAKALVRNKVGKKVEFGLPYLLNQIGGGFVFGLMLVKCPNEAEMPMLSLQLYREIFGKEANPVMITYDRGGGAKETIKKIKQAGIAKVGIAPRGKAKWCVTGADRKKVMSERGKMEGSIGTLKSEKYGFNKPQERKQEQIRMAGQRSMLSLNLNRLMKNLIEAASKEPSAEA